MVSLTHSFLIRTAKDPHEGIVGRISRAKGANYERHDCCLVPMQRSQLGPKHIQYYLYITIWKKQKIKYLNLINSLVIYILFDSKLYFQSLITLMAQLFHNCSSLLIQYNLKHRNCVKVL